ncbi:MAG: hypothetical protein H0W07_07270 [Chloroflexi bacterium]|nr:hypothetical protein [Chloroflexota bacterium]
MSLQPLQTDARARQEALRHEAQQRRLARMLPPGTEGPTHHAAHVAHGAASPIASLRLRVGHALVLIGTALEGGSAEDPAPTR